MSKKIVSFVLMHLFRQLLVCDSCTTIQTVDIPSDSPIGAEYKLEHKSSRDLWDGTECKKQIISGSESVLVKLSFEQFEFGYYAFGCQDPVVCGECTQPGVCPRHTCRSCEAFNCGGYRNFGAWISISGYRNLCYRKDQYCGNVIPDDIFTNLPVTITIMNTLYNRGCFQSTSWPGYKLNVTVVNPTMHPTPAPSPFPSPYPTPYPTPFPTSAPTTPAPTTSPSPSPTEQSGAQLSMILGTVIPTCFLIIASLAVFFFMRKSRPLDNSQPDNRGHAGAENTLGNVNTEAVPVAIPVATPISESQRSLSNIVPEAHYVYNKKI